MVDDVDLTHEAPAGHFSCCASELPPPPLHAASTTSNANPATNRVTSAWWHSSPGSSARDAAEPTPFDQDRDPVYTDEPRKDLFG